MKYRASTTLAGDLIKKIAPKIGAKVIMEPQWGHVGQIVFPSGRKRYFRFSSLDINALGASEISKDKDFANFFMKGMGYPTIPGRTFFRADWARTIHSKRNIDSAYEHATALGFPVFLKPNSGSQGNGACLVHTKREFYKGMQRAFKIDRVVLVQSPVSGKDYRVVVLDNKVISAYERIPLNVSGNGKSSVVALLKAKQRDFLRVGRDTKLNFADPRIVEKLKRSGLTLRSVPKLGETIFLLDNANLSAGGDSKDVTQRMHLSFKKVAINLTKDMGLRLCGVDLMIAGDINEKAERFWILEVNSAPGLDHYARSGRTQGKIVEQMYLDVLKSMDRK
jgi:D-alanine-D-alanine ligase-like ATP-grasp enzyme